MTLHLSFPSMYKTRYKSTFKNKAIGPRLKKLGHPVFFFFSLLLSFSGWSLGTQRLFAFTFLPGFLRPEQEDVLRLYSLGRPGRHLWPPWTGQTSCLEVLLAFYVNQGISASFSPVFLSTIFFPYRSLNHPPTPFFLQVPLDPAGAGPRHNSGWTLRALC